MESYSLLYLINDTARSEIELKTINYNTVREMAPIRTIGNSDPCSFSRGKRRIAGTVESNTELELGQTGIIRILFDDPVVIPVLGEVMGIDIIGVEILESNAALSYTFVAEDLLLKNYKSIDTKM
jgi:hypothetical protein